MYFASSVIYIVFILRALANPFAELQTPNQPISHDAGRALFLRQSPGFLDDRDEVLDKCSPATSPFQQRDLHNIEWEYGRNISLLWERMDLPTGDMQAFYKKEFPLADAIVWQVDGDDANTAIYRRLDDKPWSCGFSGLCGCTTLIVISRVAVYATHWWENISFAPDDEFRDSPTETDEAVFERTVVTPIHDGKNTKQKGGTFETHAALNPAIDDGNTIQAYLIHPQKGWNGVMDAYRTQWDRIKKEVGDIAPSLKDDARWTEIVYNRLASTNTDLKYKARGKGLFKFDPKHMGKPKAALWVEDKTDSYYNVEWA